MPPLSTIIRPPHQGYSDKKKKPKPAKPGKEEGKEENSEEVGEEQNEENSTETQENANEAVGISSPPDGASVAEAKPIGLAIAGPGGVAAAKPQGTAVVGPGGLAIARPVGTAIAGVEVEGSVPIGGQHKHKKKPKQGKNDKETPEGELHYVGGFTGPIGNPQPTRKQFENLASFKSYTAGDENDSGFHEKLFFQGRQNNQAFQLKLGQKDGKYGFISPFLSSAIQEGRDFGEKIEAPVYFYGPIGTDGNDENVFRNQPFRRT